MLMQKLIWTNVKDNLPTDVQRYAVIMTNGVITTDLRTPSKKELTDSSYAWFQLLVDYWCPLPTAYYPYIDADVKHQWIDSRNSMPIIDGNKKAYFVTLNTGVVTVDYYRTSSNTFDLDHVDGTKVIAWMEMPELPFVETDFKL